MLLQHNRVQHYLGIEPSVQINFECVNNKNQEVILKDEQATNKTKVHNELLAQIASVGQHSTSEPPEKVSCHNKLPNDNQQHTDPPSGHQRATTQSSPFPPSVYAALSQLTDADSKAIQSSSTLTECMKTLVFLASSNGITERQSNSFHEVISPSKLFESVSKSKLARLEKKADFCNYVNLKISRKKTKMSNLSCLLYGVMMMMAPKLSLEIAESICVLAISAYMNDCSFNIDQIGNSTSSTSTLKEIILMPLIMKNHR